MNDPHLDDLTARPRPRLAGATPATTGHDHGVADDADHRYLVAALALIAAFMVGEVVAAVLSGSLALFADAGHMLTDVAALAASVVRGPPRHAGPPAGAGPTGSGARRSSPPPSTASPSR